MNLYITTALGTRGVTPPNVTRYRLERHDTSVRTLRRPPTHPPLSHPEMDGVLGRKLERGGPIRPREWENPRKTANTITRIAAERRGIFQSWWGGGGVWGSRKGLESPKWDLDFGNWISGMICSMQMNPESRTRDKSRNASRARRVSLSKWMQIAGSLRLSRFNDI